MDIYTYWMEAIFGRNEKPEETETRMKDWYEHLWNTI